MMKKTKICMVAVLCLLSAYLCMPLTASASTLELNDFIDGMSVNGDLRIRYEYKEKDVPNEDATERMRTRFRLGMKWNNPDENWKIAAGLCTGGSDATSTNETWSDGEMFATPDIRLDYAYAEHTLNNFKFIAGQQKNPFETTWALWDGDVRPAGFTGMVDLEPMFVTVGWYDVLYYNHDIANMEAVQLGAKTDMLTAALSFYNYSKADKLINAVIAPAYGLDTSNMDPDYKYQIVDLYLNADIKTDVAKISPHAQAFMNVGAKGNKGQSLFDSNLDPEKENLGWLVGVEAGIDKVSIGVDYAEIGADSCIPLLKDSDFGDALQSVDVKGFKFELGYKLTKNCKLAGTALLYKAKERDINQDPKTYQFDLSYKF